MSSKYPKIILFTTFKPFIKKFVIEQENAIKSWKTLTGIDKIVVIGNDEGVKERCEQYDLIHHPDVLLNSSNTPSVYDLFTQGWKYGDDEDVFIYINGDIMIGQDTINTVMEFYNKHVKPTTTYFLTSSRRDWKHIKEVKSIDEVDLKDTTISGPSAIDIFIHRKNNLPIPKHSSLARTGYDVYILAKTNETFDYCVDITNTSTLIHPPGDLYVDGECVPRGTNSN